MGGRVVGEVLLSSQPFSFWGGYDPIKGIVTDVRHEWKGLRIAGKVLVFPRLRGSTGGAGIFLESVRRGNAPSAMVVLEAETILVAGPMLSRIFYRKTIPVIDRPDLNPIEVLSTGDIVEVDGDKGLILIKQERIRKLVT